MILLLLLVFTVQAASAMVPESIFLRAGAIDAEPATEEQESVPDIGNIIFEHVLDSYEWHLTEWKGKPVAIHLPVILIDRGIHAFNSREIIPDVIDRPAHISFYHLHEFIHPRERAQGGDSFDQIAKDDVHRAHADDGNENDHQRHDADGVEDAVNLFQCFHRSPSPACSV